MHDLAISLTNPRLLSEVGRGRGIRAIAPSGDTWLPLMRVLGHEAVTRVYLGNEFCENLILSPERLGRALQLAAALPVRTSLVTPMVTDGGMARLGPLLELLAEETEVIVNDWGILRLVRGRFPHLVPVAGRLLSKQVKDPRLPSSEWNRLVPHGLFAPSFRDFLLELGVRRMEIDLPPHFDPAGVRSVGLSLTAHAPYGYCAKGRICRIGSLALAAASKFAPGHGCRRECLTYVARMERRAAGKDDLHTFQRGNTLFYRYSEEMTLSLGRLLAERAVDRVVVSGDWHEDHGAA